eukprot:CAMPEP_0178417466 /NCGR_PEP_ID=MMETSP0689_2-20121128/24588_1 /TAXON_ID=160604 /ORGANISM="Amphidinium massartii, Strain CS-259" /LENGTH=449 /DNA_ID=CAMNT_0020038831 /DNA_START=78 /DNA_END=1427 /DNA_ORIENTATION=+
MNRENRVWVGGLPQNVKEDELSEAFGACGTVTKIQIRHSQIDTFAFVSFADRKGYDKALATMDQSKFFGQPMKVNVVIQKGEEGGRSSGRDRDRDRGDRDEEAAITAIDLGDVRTVGGRPGGVMTTEVTEAEADPIGTVPLHVIAIGIEIEVGVGVEIGTEVLAIEIVIETGTTTGMVLVMIAARLGADMIAGGRPIAGRVIRAEIAEVMTGEVLLDLVDRDGDARRGRDFSPDDRPQRTYSRMDDDGGSRIWVGGMPKNITESEIDHVFKRYGPVEEIVIRHSEFDTFGFVQFKNTSHASAAIKDLDQASRFGVTIKVAYAGGKSKGKGKGDGRDGKGGDRKGGGGGGRPRSARSRSRDNDGKSGVRHCVRLENLPNDMEADELLELAKEYGKVLHHEVWSDAKSRTNGGMIEYGTKEEGAAALDALNDRAMDGWDKKIQARYEQRDG